jgi:NhaA family Na+:H+ antiporter
MSASEPSAGKQKHGIFQRFLHSQVAGSVVLLACTILALIWANSPAGDSYRELTHTYVGVSFGEHSFKLSLQHWINDLLMAVFFFVVGLEIKREMVLGELSSFRKAILPVTAAVGGMVVPAAIYLMFNIGGKGGAGWGIPMATDIAFALGILAIFGKRVPLGLKVFLTALAIADDMGAVLVIALFYTEQVSLKALIVAGVFLLLLLVASRANVRRVGVWAFLLIGVWLAVFASGVHATVAGILVAMVVPVRARMDPHKFVETVEANWRKLDMSKLTQESMVSNNDQYEALRTIDLAATDMLPPGLVLERYLHVGQAFLILPLFAFFNAGVKIGGDYLELLSNPISLGIILGLVLGKQIGVFLFSWLAIKTGRAALPTGVSWGQMWGVSCLAGVGFTMSLFISELAFEDPELVSEAKIGILMASLIAGVLGYLVLTRALPRRGT